MRQWVIAVQKSKERPLATLIFDTHAFAKQLAEAGMPEPPAEVPGRHTRR
jgi:hypothetical protein